MSYVGNCSSVIDWNSIVKELDLYEGTFRGFETPYEKQVTIDLVKKPCLLSFLNSPTYFSTNRNLLSMYTL